MFELSLFKLIRSFLLVAFIGAFEYRRGSFTISGAIVGCFICFFIAYANIVFLLVMITFVLSGSISTRYKHEIKQMKFSEDTGKNSKKSKARNHIQVLCNGGIASVYACLYCWKTNFSGRVVPIDFQDESSIYSIGFLFTIVCCCADTLASEIGSVLSKENPRLLTNPFRSVPVGTNGGISTVGSLWSLIGGGIVGLSYIIGNLIFCRPEQLSNTTFIHLQILFHSIMFGLLGSLIDSLLGATLQFSGFDQERNIVVQSPGESIQRISGRDILSNNQVNLISSFLTSIIAIYMLPKCIMT